LNSGQIKKKYHPHIDFPLSIEREKERINIDNTLEGRPLLEEMRRKGV
jgi:hypothetical protein